MLSTLEPPATIAEAASALNVSRKTVQRLISRGALTSVKLPGRTGAHLIARGDLLALVAERKAS